MAKSKPALDLKFISHGTLESKNLQRTREFYEDFMGFECVQTSDISMMCRLGGEHVYVAVENKARKGEMPFLNHNGVDVRTEEEVDQAYEIVKKEADKWGLYKISEPKNQHGSYSFYFWDMDDNSWEILCNPPGGYTWMFKRGEKRGLDHLSQGAEDQSRYAND